jgi:hypothetical protein
VQKNTPTLGFDPRTVQAVISRYSDYAIPEHLVSVQYVEKIIDGFAIQLTKLINDEIYSTNGFSTECNGVHFSFEYVACVG